MTTRHSIQLILVIYFNNTVTQHGGEATHCGDGYYLGTNRTCVDDNECGENEAESSALCGTNTVCHNTIGSFYCTCKKGYASESGETNFTTMIHCRDIDECETDLCGSNATCTNTIGSFSCTCNGGFVSTLGGNKNVTQPCIADKDECQDTVAACGHNASCNNTMGGFNCTCDAVFASSTEGSNRAINCQDLTLLRPRSSSLQDIDVFTNQYFSSLSKIEDRHSEMFRKLVSNFLEQMEKHTLALANTLGHEEMKNFSTNGFDVNMQAIRNSTIPKGGRTKLSTSRNSMDISWNNVAGKEKFDVAAAALISYKELDSLMKDNQLDSGEKLELISEVVTAAVTNKVKENPNDPVILTFENKKHSNKKVKCVYWDSSVAAWSIQGCSLRDSNVTVTVCSCTHLSSFAVLMALHDIGEIHSFNLHVITTVGIILSLVCLFISILTFILCRSIKSVRTTIHTHLCVSLFLAEFLFLVGISRTENQTSCAIIAGLLHYLFLACFSWMLLEGIQLYLMVVKVFNANSMRLRYMCLFGYGFPLLVVTISAVVYSEGYGTDRYCWLSLKSGFLWAFIAPVCVIILVNTGFFILTVWRLVNKFSSLNPDMSELKKVRAFTFTAIAQLCLLGCTWIFGMLHFQENTIVMAYIFTVINSLQGAFIFILHCLFNKQVRDEYSKAFIRVCQMKKASKYSEFSTFSTQGLKSTNETGM